MERAFAVYLRALSWLSCSRAFAVYLRALLAACVVPVNSEDMERVDVPELVGDFLSSLQTWISSSDVDLSAGLSLSKTSLRAALNPLQS